MPDLHELLKDVESREDLALFVKVMQRDLQTRAYAWENPTLEGFLEAMGGWIEDTNRSTRTQDKERFSNASWKAMAEILYAASLYE